MPFVVKSLEPRLSVSSQIGPADLAEIRRAGFRSIVCNRPDGEALGQPCATEVAQQAERIGMPFRCIPVLGSAITDADIDAFRRALKELPQPLLAYCRSGNRCTLLWALAEAGSRPVSEIEAIAEHAGYSLAALKPRLLALAERHAG